MKNYFLVFHMCVDVNNHSGHSYKPRLNYSNVVVIEKNTFAKDKYETAALKMQNKSKQTKPD